MRDVMAEAQKVATALDEIRDEYCKAVSKHRPFHSPHEGVSVVFEELGELWREVTRRELDRDAMHAEAIQVAATALRFVVDLCDYEYEPPQKKEAGS